MRSDAERWFRHIGGKSPLKTKFDLYYFCLMLGLACQRRSNPGEISSAPGFVDNMPEDFRQMQEIIMGILLYVEIARMGVELTEREDVRRILASLVGTNGISPEGVNRMNEYSSGGFDLLQEHGITEPYEVSEFMIAYHDLLISFLN